MNIGFNGWIIRYGPTAPPEFGVTFSWSRSSISVCVYLVMIAWIVSLYWRREKDKNGK